MGEQFDTLDPFAEVLSPLIAPTSSSTTDNTQPTVSATPTDNSSGFLDTTLGFVGQLLQVLQDIPQDLLGLEQLAEKSAPIAVVEALAIHIARGFKALDVSAWLGDLSKAGTSISKDPTQAETDAFNIWQWMSEVSGGLFYTAFLKFGLGIEVDKFSDDAQKGVDTTDMLIGFTIALQYGLAILEVFGEGIFANRWAKPLIESISKIPEEMGLSWAMGMNIEEAYAVAVGKSIEEEINYQKRPNRIEWPVLRQVLKQKPYERDKIRELLQHQGFPEYQVDFIMELTDAEIPVGDLQQLYLYGLLKAEDIPDRIKRLGFSDDNANLLDKLYILKANTPSGSELRSTYRQLFQAQLVDEDTYRNILAQTNTPPLEIENDIAAIKALLKYGHVNESTAVIKARRIHNIIDDGEAVTKLKQLGLTDEAAADMVASWLLPPIHPKHGLSQARILSYYISGVLTAQEAAAQLQDSGLNSNAINLLIAHPNAHPQVTIHRLTPSFVITAYLDGAIGEPELRDKFTLAGVPDSDLDYWVTIAHYRYTHRKQSSGGTVALTKGEIIDAFKYGIYDEQQALTQLEHLNYDTTNATILLEIANKGVFQPSVAPAFANLGEAIGYLQAQGYQVFPPQDPKITAAEGMLANAGYSYQAPPGIETSLPLGGINYPGIPASGTP